MDILLRKKSVRARIFSKQIKHFAHNDFGVCSLNAKSFYHGISNIGNSTSSYSQIERIKHELPIRNYRQC